MTHYGSSGMVAGDCEDVVDSQMGRCNGKWSCKCEDSVNNTYACLRTINRDENSIVCQFNDDEGFIEVYDLNVDPYQLNNIYVGNNEDTKLKYPETLETLKEIANIVQETP